MDSGSAARGNRKSKASSSSRAGAGDVPVSDSDLGARARAGDRHAFGEIYRRYAPFVHGVLVAHAPLRDVNDLVQDVFVLALRSIESLEDPERLGPWLSTIARNRARDRHKRGARERSEDAMLEPESRETIDTEGDEDLAHGILESIRGLPESYRETLVLRLVEGLSGSEIATRTGLTHGSVRVNLFRGMNLLRERLERGSRKGSA